MKDSSEFLTEDVGLFKHLLTPVLLVQEASDSQLQQRKLWWLVSHEGQGFIIIHIQFRKNKKIYTGRKLVHIVRQARHF